MKRQIRRIIIALIMPGCLGTLVGPEVNPARAAEPKDQESSNAQLQTLSGSPGPPAPQVWHRERIVHILMPQRMSPRVAYGMKQLEIALTQKGLVCVRLDGATDSEKHDVTISIGITGKDTTAAKGMAPDDAAESFTISPLGATGYVITGRDDSGVMYGCLEFAERVLQAEGLPALAAPVSESPAMRLRLSTLYMCLPTGSRDGGFYDFLWTPENFPWFYDKAHWTEYLDLLARSRYNGLVLWAGHPFTSILRLPNFPEAQELSDEQLQRNIEMFGWITQEAERRGIWTAVHFYNIRISHSLAKAHGVSIGQYKPTPLNSAYTRHCVSEFIRSYPHVGLMVCLGEYLYSEYDAEWLAEVIIPGVKEVLNAGQEEPPLILRSHDCPFDEVLAKASYSNIYTTSKYSSEALISHVVGGGPGNNDVMSWKFSKDLAQQHPHILELMFISNLQPCQHASPRFARGALQSCAEIGAQGVQHFPLHKLEWPYTMEIAEPRVRQIDRDWMYYESWGRAAWNPKRADAEARNYWIWRLGEKYGVSPETAGKILDASEASAEIMPHVTRALSNQPWNIQSHMLGQTMEQTLSIAGRWYAPPGETIEQYAEKEARGQPHEGETPLAAAAKIQADGTVALRRAEEVAPQVTRNRDSFGRWLRELKITKSVGDFYSEKTQSAISAQLYFKTRDTTHLAAVEKHLEDSLRIYRKLVQLTDGIYSSVGGWDAVQQIPFRHPITRWTQVLPRFEQELDHFRTNARYLREHPLDSGEIKPYPSVEVKVHAEGCELFELKLGARPYTEDKPSIHRLLPELAGLPGIRFSSVAAESGSQEIAFELREPARVFVGFGSASGDPQLGTGSSSVPGNWAAPSKDWDFYAKEGCYLYLWHEYHMARCDVYMKEFPAGGSVLSFGPGAFVVLGFAKTGTPLVPTGHRIVQPGLWFTHDYTSMGKVSPDFQ